MSEQTVQVEVGAAPATETEATRVKKAVTRDPILVALIRTCDLIDKLNEADQVFAAEFIYQKYTKVTRQS